MSTANVLFSSLDVLRKIIGILAGILITRVNLWLLVPLLHIYTLQDYFTFGEKNFYSSPFLSVRDTFQGLNDWHSVNA